MSKIHLNLLGLPIAIKGAGQELFIRKVLEGKENLQGTSISRAVAGSGLMSLQLSPGRVSAIQMAL